MTKTNTTHGRLERLLARRPHDLAQLDARELDEPAELRAVAAENATTSGSEHQTADDRRPAQPGPLVLEQVIARDAGDHQYDRNGERFALSAATAVPEPLSSFCHIKLDWQARRESNPQPAVLETAALPIELLAYSYAKLPALRATFQRGRIRSPPANVQLSDHLRRQPVLPKASLAHLLQNLRRRRLRRRSCRPRGSRSAAPPPSRSGLISSTVILMLSPGITISMPAGNSIAPVTSVVRK